MTHLRTGQYDAENRASERRGKDRIRGKPQNLRTLLRWLTSSYALEVPGKLHSGATLEEDGDPAMTGEAQSWLGMHDDSQPNDWIRVACRTDADGYFSTPMRCAIARVHQAERRNLLAELATNLLFPKAVMDANLIPAWAQNDVLGVSLSILWDTYADRPLPRSTVNHLEKSESQRAAEDAA